MYPSRAAARRLPSVGEILDCGRGDRGALRDCVDASDVPLLAARRARRPRTAPGSTVDRERSLRKGPAERRNARSVARHRPGASETNSEKLAAVRASAILRKPLLRISRGCSYSNLKARSANSGPSSYGAGDRAWSGPVRANFRPGPALRWSAESGPRSGRWQQRYARAAQLHVKVRQVGLGSPTALAAARAVHARLELFIIELLRNSSPGRVLPAVPD